MVIKKDFRIGDALIKKGLVSLEDIEEALRLKERTGEYLWRALVKLGVVKEKDLLQVLSEQLSVPYIDLRATVSQDEAVKKVPAKFASHYKLMPVRIQNGTLMICVNDPLDVHTLDDMRALLECNIEVAVSEEQSILEAIQKHYGLGAGTVEKMVAERAREAPAAAGARQEVSELDKSTDAAIVQFVNQMMLEAQKKRATDIHIEPFEDEMKVRYRIDGILYVAKIPPQLKQFQSSIVSRVKIMSGLDIAEHRLPQDGRIKVKTKEREMDLRVSVLPTYHGETINIRLLSSNVLLGFEELGLSEKHRAILERILRKPHGIVFLTGPTGSGKTTTLYSCLARINDQTKKIITIEDPIEYQMKGVTQIQVQPKIGLTFAAALRSMLRHDPNVMMVGEVRDTETAEITIRTALTGHFVLSTLHTNDAPSSITRLVDMGVEPFLVASSVECIIAQRLARRICLKCKREAKVKPELLAEMPVPKGASIVSYEGKGCEGCGMTGYLGRLAIHEMLVMTDEVRDLAVARASANEIRRKAREQGMATLREDGWEKACAGLTSVEELLRVTQMESS